MTKRRVEDYIYLDFGKSQGVCVGNFSYADIVEPMIGLQIRQDESGSPLGSHDWLFLRYGRHRRSAHSKLLSQGEWGRANTVSGHSYIGGMLKSVGVAISNASTD